MARLLHWLALALALALAAVHAQAANATGTGGGAGRPAPEALRAPPPPPPPPPRDDELPSGEEGEDEGEEEGGEEGRCGFPGAPAHSSVSLSDERLREGAVATYSCERGFELLGPARRVCGPHARWSPDGIPFCVLNVAAGKAPMQSSTEVAPQRAVDGSTSAAFSAATCSLTRPERAPWWYVNLLEPYMVQLVRLDFGKACCGAQGAATVVVRVGNSRPDLGANPVCNRFSGALSEGRPLFLPCNPPMPGAFVSVHLEAGGGGAAQLALCEAFVYTDQALPMERCPQFRDAPPGSAATYNGKCYAFHSRTALPFREALAFCRARGGALLDESNPALQGFVSWELWRRPPAGQEAPPPPPPPPPQGRRGRPLAQPPARRQGALLTARCAADASVATRAARRSSPQCRACLVEQVQLKRFHGRFLALSWK